jgi:hypothetical protein
MGGEGMDFAESGRLFAGIRSGSNSIRFAYFAFSQINTSIRMPRENPTASVSFQRTALKATLPAGVGFTWIWQLLAGILTAAAW